MLANPAKIPPHALRRKHVAKINPTDLRAPLHCALNMKRPIAPPLSDHRLARLVAWAGLWLVWASAFLAGVNHCFRKTRKLEKPRRQVMAMTRLVIALLYVHATKYVTHIARISGAYDPTRRRRSGRYRAECGLAIRRAFRASTLLGRIAKLSDALRHPEQIARALARRIMRNLTRRSAGSWTAGALARTDGNIPGETPTLQLQLDSS